MGYDLTDHLNLTAGLRYGRDQIAQTSATYLRLVTGFVLNPAPSAFSKGNFDALTGGANLSYTISPGVIVYGSYSRGNSPGGFNTGAFSKLNFAQQKVNAYEVGLKSQLLDRHLRFNLAAFDNQYSNLQLSQNLTVFGQVTPLTTNAGKAHGRGVDLDTVAILSPNLHLGLQYTYVDSKITRYAIQPGAPQVDLTGASLVRSPKNTANGSITFLDDIGPGKFQFTAEESYSSSYTNDYQGVPAGTAYPGIPGVLPPGVTTGQVLNLFRVPGYAVTNLNASYTYKNWQLTGYVRNLLNHQYIVSAIAFDLVTQPLETPGEPRTYGATLKYSF